MHKLFIKSEFIAILIIAFVLLSTSIYAAFLTKPYDFTIEKGTWFNPIIIWEDESRHRVDLTGSSAQMVIRKFPTASPSFNLSTTNNGIYLQRDAVTTNAIPYTVTGTISVVMTAGQTSALNFSAGSYELNITFPDTTIWRIMFGNISVR